MPLAYRKPPTCTPPRNCSATRRNADTEEAVRRALHWLAVQQSADGRWVAAAFGAGRESRVAGQDRGGTGAHADTGLTGLALLAFLGAGETHLAGTHREHVQHGLEFLLRSQRPDGELAGSADLFARMYCHGMATLALSEALALTGDERIRPFLERAVSYTIRAQDPQTGGWRYRPGDSGDTSQFGWQLMALKSAQQSGIPIPPQTWQNARRFLQSVTSGQHLGLASYRPGERPSRTMTAEAVICRILLGELRDSQVREALAFVLQELPSSTAENHYYWYYGTLALFQTQGDGWPVWNDALQRQLLAKQRQDSAQAGSWDPDPVWGAHGGRVFSTAMGALCLEVYYRYLPLYQTARAGEATLPR
ncbi:MAG: prenyltransferase/squalene oxidase repeat-containing protein [Pirellulales bacterium]